MKAIDKLNRVLESIHGFRGSRSSYDRRTDEEKSRISAAVSVLKTQEDTSEMTKEEAREVLKKHGVPAPKEDEGVARTKYESKDKTLHGGNFELKDDLSVKEKHPGKVKEPNEKGKKKGKIGAGYWAGEWSEEE